MGTMQIYQRIASRGGGGVTSVLLVENCFAHPCYDIFSNLVSHFVVDDKGKLRKVNTYLYRHVY